jgi:hypothetical protein
MSTAPARLSGPSRGVHPVVFNRRMRELALLGASIVVPLAAAMAISIAVPDPNVGELLVLAAGVLAVVALLVSPRYEITITVIVLYLGLLDGPVKLGIGGHTTVSAVRDVLIGAVCLGALLRLLVSRARLTIPPLSAWVAAYVAAVLVEALNPHTHGITKALGGFRQLLEWVPFFFFGYALMRSKQRFRRLFLILGVIALANAVVGTYQAKLGPTQLAAWGPGYSELELGGKGLSGRTFVSEGETRVRPPGLGTDAGFGGDIGLLAVPACLALLAGSYRRRRWPAALLSLAAMVAVATGLGRLQVVGALVAVLAFVSLAFSTLMSNGGRRAVRRLTPVLGVLALAIPVGAVYVTAVGSGAFARYGSIVTGEDSDNNKLPGLTRVPNQLIKAPFGVGLGVAGAAAGFGGTASEALNGKAVNAETQYNFLVDELGFPGLLLWVGFAITLVVLAGTRLTLVRDPELRIYIAALLAAFLALLIIGFYGPTLTSAALGPFFWFFGGIVAYWFAGPGRSALAPVGGERLGAVDGG